MYYISIAILIIDLYLFIEHWTHLCIFFLFSTYLVEIFHLSTFLVHFEWKFQKSGDPLECGRSDKGGSAC